MLPLAPQPITIRRPRTLERVLPILPGIGVNLGVLIAVAMVPAIWFLLYRTTLGLRDPGCRARTPTLPGTVACDRAA